MPNLQIPDIETPESLQSWFNKLKPDQYSTVDYFPVKLNTAQTKKILEKSNGSGSRLIYADLTEVDFEKLNFTQISTLLGAKITQAQADFLKPTFEALLTFANIDGKDPRFAVVQSDAHATTHEQPPQKKKHIAVQTQTAKSDDALLFEKLTEKYDGLRNSSCCLTFFNFFRTDYLKTLTGTPEEKLAKARQHAALKPWSRTADAFESIRSEQPLQMQDRPDIKTI